MPCADLSAPLSWAESRRDRRSTSATRLAARRARLDGRREMLGEARLALMRHDDRRIANSFAINL
jgi:hypothetical protein